jgi:signal peptide peptidase SppA
MSDPQAPAAPQGLDGRHYPLIASRVFDTPLLIEQSKLEAILQVLGPRLGFSTVPHVASGQVYDYKWSDGGYKVNDRVATLEVFGTLIQRHDFFSEASGFSSYSQIQRRFDKAMADDDVDEILMVYDTPGGEVAGAFDLAEHMYQARGTKKITAIASEVAASAGYLLASTADEIVIPRTGFVGSIGVVTAHVDWSKAMEKRGAAITFIYAGDKKIDGNAYQPLPESVKKETQERINDLYRIFTSSVAKFRDMDEDDVIKTQAGMFMAEKAISVKLADRIGHHAGTLQELVTRTSGKNRSTYRGNAMSDKQKEETTNANTHTQAHVDSARNEGKTEGQKAGASAERERVKAIMTSEEAKGRDELANHLAFDTSMSAEEAVKLLAKSPKAEAPKKQEEAKKSPLEEQMSKNENKPNLKSDDSGNGEDEGVADVATRIAGYANPAKTTK